MASRSEWRGLTRELRSGRRSQPSGWWLLAGWFWRHLPEFLVGLVLLIVWRRLAGLAGGVIATLVLVAVLAGVVAWSPSRRVVMALVGWRLTRHGLRAGLLEARVVSASGRLPSHLCSWPTSVGERVWLWCPPRIAAEDIEDETDQLRAACVAREVRVTRDVRWSALVVVDVIRRDTLSAKRVIPAPITAHVHNGQLQNGQSLTTGEARPRKGKAGAAGSADAGSVMETVKQSEEVVAGG